MIRFRNNLIANFAGKGAAALISLFLVPLYVRILGIESYGLVGFYQTLIVFSTLLDFGFSTGLNREVARLSGVQGGTAKIGVLFFTLEKIYMVLVFLLVGLSFVASKFSVYWFNANTLSGAELQNSTLFMGIAVAAYCPFFLYSECFIGLQRHVVLNTIHIIMSLFRGFGALVVLNYYPTIQAFFLWQIVINLIQIVVLASQLRRRIPKTKENSCFDLESIKRIWRFSLGITANSLSSLVLTQMDKIILSKFATLEQLGYYTIAYLVANGLSIISLSFYQTFFPLYSKLVKQKKRLELVNTYHYSSRLLSSLICPVTFVLTLFSYEILRVWAGASVANESWFIAVILIIGSALHAIMHLPYGLRLAYGWTRLSLYQDLIGITILLPLTIWSARAFGGKGVAFSWLLLNMGYFLIGIQVMHTKILRQDKRRWYAAVLLPGFSIVIPLVFRFCFPRSEATFVVISVIAIVIFLSVGSSFLYALKKRAYA